jgi:hypothetical protein
MVPLILMASMAWLNDSTREFIQFGRDQDHFGLDQCIRGHTALHTENAPSNFVDFQSIWSFQ